MRIEKWQARRKKRKKESNDETSKKKKKRLKKTRQIKALLLLQPCIMSLHATKVRCWELWLHENATWEGVYEKWKLQPISKKIQSKKKSNGEQTRRFFYIKTSPRKEKHNRAKALNASITKIRSMPLAIYHLGLALYFDNVLILELYPPHKTKL